jgi:hypothetical protein
MRVVARLGEILFTTWVSTSSVVSWRRACGNMVAPKPRNKTKRRVEEERQCLKVCWSDGGNCIGSVSPRSFMPVVP